MISEQRRFTFFWLLLGFALLCCSDDDTDTPVQDGGGVPKDARLIAEKTATDSGNNQYKVGFDQVSGNNQNPYVEKIDAQGNRLWRRQYEDTGVDGRGVWVVVDSQDRPWVAFTVDGGSNDNGYITKKHVDSGAFSGVYMDGYGRGGGPKVSVLARLNPNNGHIEKGTFLAARLTNGRTNTLRIEKIGFNAGNLALETSSSAWPPGVGSSYGRLPDITDADRVAGNFLVYYELNTNLSEILVAKLLK